MALDNPAKSVAVQRDAIDIARRQGRRATEALLVGNAGEDARRTGEWDWADEQLARLLDTDLDPETSVMATSGVAYLRLYRGELVAGELEEMRARIDAMSDTDMRGVRARPRRHRAVPGGRLRGRRPIHPPRGRDLAPEPPLHAPVGGPDRGAGP